VTGITPYPACAKTAFRIGASTLSAEIDRTAGLIVRLSTPVFQQSVFQISNIFALVKSILLRQDECK